MIWNILKAFEPAFFLRNQMNKFYVQEKENQANPRKDEKIASYVIIFFSQKKQQRERKGKTSMALQTINASAEMEKFSAEKIRKYDIEWNFI
ncbi:hypothetical protein TNCT_426551 [Trichonephila clavata]|uniref:Uncharacterized protein n=1 Tax=Trichonephila clavata TaxID=2740835 RepID=A0A8X6F6N0_TRICU|nr:hypothetical protein TNCT_426551 [Trichonephila clavata]